MITEADTCRKYVLPKLYAAGWNDDQISEQKSFTDGRVIPIGEKSRRRRPKRADYLLRYTRDLMIAVVEAKPSYKLPSDGLQQAKDYAEILGLKFAYATNGHGVVEFNYLTGKESEIESFPTPDELWSRLRSSEGLTDEQLASRALTPSDTSIGKGHRYYREIARGVRPVCSPIRNSTANRRSFPRKRSPKRGKPKVRPTKLLAKRSLMSRRSERSGRLSAMILKENGGSTTSMAGRSKSSRTWSMSWTPTVSSSASLSLPTTWRTRSAPFVLLWSSCAGAGQMPISAPRLSPSWKNEASTSMSFEPRPASRTRTRSICFATLLSVRRFEAAGSGRTNCAKIRKISSNATVPRRERSSMSSSGVPLYCPRLGG